MMKEYTYESILIQHIEFLNSDISGIRCTVIVHKEEWMNTEQNNKRVETTNEKYLYIKWKSEQNKELYQYSECKYIIIIFWVE